jgi:hypothetical protein
MPKAKTSPASRRRDTRRKFVWLQQVSADRELPPSASKVALGLVQLFNAEYGGAAWPSSLNIARAIGLSEPSIIRITRQLARHGHLRIDPGKAGRGGHTNQYFMVIQTSAGGGLQTSTGESQTSASGGDLLETPLRDPKGSPVREGERSRSLAVPGAPLAAGGGAPDGFKQEAFATLLVIWSVRPWPNTSKHETDARLAFAVACAEAHPDEIIAAARAWVAAIDNPKHLPKLADWLGNGNWRKPPPSRLKRGKVSAAEAMFRQGENS